MASYFVDLDGLTLYVANDLDRAENLVWAFDDLLIVVTWEGVRGLHAALVVTLPWWHD